MRILFWILILSQCVAIMTHPPAPGCEGKKIAIVDLSDLSELGNFPKCDINQNVHIEFANGMAFSLKRQLSDPMPHMFGVNANPWFLSEAIKSSTYYTEDLEEADIIYVYDYCYYITWLADVHTNGRDHQDGPGDDLLQAYKTMLELPIWKKYDGGNFAFFDSHCGFMAGKAQPEVQAMKCSTFKNAINIIVDTPMKNICKEFWSFKKLLIAPYVPIILNRSNPEANLYQKFRPAEVRPIMAFSRARCVGTKFGDTIWATAGLHMRYWFSYVEWGSMDDMDVRCTEKDLNPGGGFLAFATMLDKMRSTKFCPAFSGDAQSSRRLSEIFLTGCIPVFLGPPYHTMPSPDQVPWPKVGLFFNIKNNSMWLKEGSTQWKLHPTIRPSHESDAQWWIPDADIPKEDFIEVDQPHEVLTRMQSMSNRQLNRLLLQVHKAAPLFSYAPRLTDPPNAVNSLISGMCIKQSQNPPQLVSR